jgi:TRAP-type C4-dicarboxylate transport system permease small subunit
MILAFLLCILGLSVSLFLLIYGIKGGLIEKKMLNNGWRQTYDIGRSAVVRGLFYISLGAIGLLITFFGLRDLFRQLK